MSGLDKNTLLVMLNVMPFPACVLDTQLRALRSNALWERFLGSHPEYPDPLTGTERLRWEPAVQALMAKKSGESSESTHIHHYPPSPSHPAPAHQMMTVLQDTLGSPVGVLIMYHTNMDARFSQFQERSPLEVTRQLAVALNHEINNPLFVIYATLEDLQSEVTSPASRERLQKALEAARRVTEAMQKLQDLRQLVTTDYVEGTPMIDLDASQDADLPRC